MLNQLLTKSEIEALPEPIQDTLFWLDVEHVCEIFFADFCSEIDEETLTNLAMVTIAMLTIVKGLKDA